VFHRVFAPEVVPIFSALSQLGLILLMFLIGLEFDFGHLRSKGSSALTISIAGIASPFILGLVIAPLLYSQIGEGINRTGFALFMATALSITAIPTLGRIMVELNIQRTYIGSLTITAAAIDDASGWTILTIVSAIVRSNFDIRNSILMVLEIIAYAAFMIFVVRPILKTWISRRLREETEVSISTLTVILVLVLLSAICTSLIGIFAIFGGFIMGAILYDEVKLAKGLSERLRDFTTAFFLPIFFTYTGLRTDVGSMGGVNLWMLAALILAAAVMGKLGGCAVAARFVGLSWRHASLVGVMMNTRGLMELIVINLGFELGVIPKSALFMLVSMAVITTYMTTPLLGRLLQTTELEPLFSASSFAQARNGSRVYTSRR
jgi:Kef-type K+ transport system membrane component KefB